MALQNASFSTLFQSSGCILWPMKSQWSAMSLYIACCLEFCGMVLFGSSTFTTMPGGAITTEHPFSASRILSQQNARTSGLIRRKVCLFTQSPGT